MIDLCSSVYEVGGPIMFVTEESLRSVDIAIFVSEIEDICLFEVDAKYLIECIDNISTFTTA